DDDAFPTLLAARALREPLRDRLAELGEPGGRRVAGAARADPRDRGLRDEGGRVEVRLARAQVDDVASLGREAACEGADGHRRGGLQLLDVRAERHPGLDRAWGTVARRGGS